MQIIRVDWSASAKIDVGLDHGTAGPRRKGLSYLKPGQ
jgi:hypothetical protein